MKRYMLIASLTVVLAGLASSPALAGGPQVGKIFDCYTYGSSGLTYVQALEIKSTSVYLLAPFRKGNHLSGRAAKGRYRSHGHKISFLSGPYAQQHDSGQFRPQTANNRATIDILDAKGNSIGISCYQH